MKNNKRYWIKGIIGVALTFSALLSFAAEEKTAVIGRFEIVRYDVHGNTILPEQEVNRLLAPYSGKDQDFASVQKAVDALESAYRQKGFSTVKVVLPEQELNQGVVRLDIVEAKIGKISVTGNKFFDEANIRRSLPALKEGETPKMLDVSKNLKLANQNPAKKNTLLLKSSNQEDTVDAEVKVTDEKPWAAAIAFDNTGDPHTGRNRITAAYQYANIGGRDHILNLQYTTSISHPADVTIFGIGYRIPLYSLGDSLDFYGSYSNVDSGNVTVGGFGFDVSGNGTVYGTRYNHNFIKKGDYDSTLSAGIEQKSFRNNISYSAIPFGNQVNVHPISLTYEGRWAVVGTTLNFSASSVHNISGGTHGGNLDFEVARPKSNPNYHLIRYNAIAAHAFNGDWQVRFNLYGQATSDALVQGEQFGIGGASSVRGFYERELTNDEGLTTNLELYTPNLCSGNLQCRLLGFYDAGYLSRNHALPGEETHQFIDSVGLGFRMTLAPNWSAQADLAHVIDGSSLSPTGSNRAHFRVMMTF